MTDDLLVKYAALFKQFEPQYYHYRDGLMMFLSRHDITEPVLEELVADYKIRRGTPDDGYMKKATDWFVMYVESFERRGTIRVNHTPEQIQEFREHCKRVRREYYKKVDPEFSPQKREALLFLFL